MDSFLRWLRCVAEQALFDFISLILSGFDDMEPKYHDGCRAFFAHAFT
jgi:hypothetical protein